MQNEEKHIKSILVKNIKRHRTKLKLTQEQASDLAGITTKYWQRLEMTSQIDLPSMKVLFKVAKALKIRAAKLLEE